MKIKKVCFVMFSTLMLLSGGFFIMKANGAITVTNIQKQIIRDTQRLSDLSKIKNAIESYKTKNGYYPRLDTGTYIRGYVNSTWDSWQGFCSLIGLSNCAIDPINENTNCDYKVFGSASLEADVDTKTCYNPKLFSATCIEGAHLYQYKSIDNGRNYALGMDLEYKKEDYFKINSTENGNTINVTGSCNGKDSIFGILSNSKPSCGNNIIEYGEICDGNKTIKMCTDLAGKTGRMTVSCNSKCVYENVNLIKNSACKVGSFCGDLIVQTDNGEECDGGSEEMCFSYGKHDWYKNQIRYCKNCKYEKNVVINSSNVNTLCGGYCGDNILNSSQGEECDTGFEYMKWDSGASKFKSCTDYPSEKTCICQEYDFNGNCKALRSGCMWNGLCLPVNACSSHQATIADCPSALCEIKNNICIAKTDTLQKEHCGIRNSVPCLYKNSPVIFPEVSGTNKNNFTVRSYYKKSEDVYEYSVVKSVDTTNKFEITKDSLFFEIKLKVGKDIEGDDVQYKFEFINKENKNIGFFKVGSNSDLISEKPAAIDGWINESTICSSSGITTCDPDGYVYVRIYSILKDSRDENKIKLIGGEYSGDYEFKVSMRDNWNSGQNVTGNKAFAETSKNFGFHVKTTCGDSILIQQGTNDDGMREFCEYNVSSVKISNFRSGEPSATSSENCVALNVSDGKWSDENCDSSRIGVCKRDKAYAGVNCNDNDFISGGNAGNFCYLKTAAKSWDDAKTYCENFGYGSKLFVIKNAKENTLIKSLNTSGSIWIGFYNINKDRTNKLNSDSQSGKTVNKESLIVSLEENGNREVNYYKIQSGGNGIKFEDQYACSNTCADVGGWCGDGIVEDGNQGLASSFWGIDSSGKYNYYINNFEECDSSVGAKMQNGVGSSKTDPYGCINCKLNGGFCGDMKVDSTNFPNNTEYNQNKDMGVGDHIDFEHCDPTYRLKAKESRNNTKDRGYGAQYICWTGNDIPTTQNISTVTWTPYQSNGTIFSSYSDYISKKGGRISFKLNEDGVCQVSSGGYCGDGLIQLSYNQMGKSDRISKNYINPVYNSLNIYSKSGTYNKNSNQFDGKGINENNSLSEMRIEECDPNYFVSPIESNSLTSGSFYKKTSFDAVSILRDNNFNGVARLKYICDSGCSLATYGFSGELFGYDNTSSGLGYCGDGIVSAYGYGKDVMKDSAIYYTNPADLKNREECDPKNHIIAPNGYGYGHKDPKLFGCYSASGSKYVYGKDCSALITPAISSSRFTYQCSYDCKNTGGYCGDGITQQDFFEECDFSDTNYRATLGVSVIKDKVSANKYKNYLCGSQHYGYGFDNEFLSGYGDDNVTHINTPLTNDGGEYSQFNSGKTFNRNLACRQFGGYLGDGKVQACIINGSGYGSEHWDLCYKNSNTTAKYTTEKYYPVHEVGDNNTYFEITEADQDRAAIFYGPKIDPGIDYLEFCDSKQIDPVSREEGCNATGTGCKPGFYIDMGICKKCTAGNFCVGSGYGKAECPAGSYSDNGQSSCTLCKLGYWNYSEPTRRACETPCEAHYKDADEDGWGGIGSQQYCNPSKINNIDNKPFYNLGYSTAKGGDCNDAKNSGEQIHPGATEVCDQIDSNCSTTYDENCDPQECRPGGKGGAFAADALLNYNSTTILSLCPPGGTVNSPSNRSYNGCIHTSFVCKDSFGFIWFNCNAAAYSRMSAQVLGNNGKFIAYVQNDRVKGNYWITCNDADGKLDDNPIYMTREGDTNLKASCLCRARGGYCSSNGNWIDSVVDKNCNPDKASVSNEGLNY